MRRGVVMEVHRKKAVILTENGSFETVRIPRSQNPQIGEEITVNPVVLSFPGKVVLPSLSLISAAMIFFILISTVLPFHINRAAAAYVSFDINPSLEVAIDEEFSVLKVTPLNKDAEILLSNPEQYIDMDFSEFSRTLFALLEGKGFFEDNRKIVIATSLSETEPNKGFTAMLTKSVTQLKNSPNLVNHNIACTLIQSNLKVRNEAKDNGLSIGKYVTYKEVVENGNSITIEDARRLPISELLEKKNLAKHSHDKQLNKQHKDKKEGKTTENKAESTVTKNHKKNNTKKSTQEQNKLAVVNQPDEHQNNGKNGGEKSKQLATVPVNENGKDERNASPGKEKGKQKNSQNEKSDNENKKNEDSDTENGDKKKHRDFGEEVTRNDNAEDESDGNEEEEQSRNDQDNKWDGQREDDSKSEEDNQHSLEINIEQNGKESTIYIDGEEIDEDLRYLLEQILDFRR